MRVGGTDVFRRALEGLFEFGSGDDLVIDRGQHWVGAGIDTTHAKGEDKDEDNDRKQNFNDPSRGVFTHDLKHYYSRKLYLTGTFFTVKKVPDVIPL